MKIGICSDSHGKASRLKTAVLEMVSRGAEALVHCGDLGSAECLAVLAGAGVPAFVACGNMDRRPASLAKSAEKCGVTVSAGSVEVPLGDGRWLTAAHGHDSGRLDELIRGGQFPYVCHGHTHRPRDERIGLVRVINPGALCCPRGGSAPTAVVLDTDADTIERIEM